MAEPSLPTSPSHTLEMTELETGSAKAVHHEATEKDTDTEDIVTELHGWRFYSVLTAIGLGIFLVQIETTIVATSLVSITNDLSGFQDVSWIVTSYLVAFSSCLTIISKLSDIFGRKSLIITCFVIYIAFSIGCGFAQSVTALIVLRALQGVGGGGIYAMCYVILPEMVAPHKLSGYASFVAGTAALASLLGPLIGGAISNSYFSAWRWIFWLNGPIGIVALGSMTIGLPKNFPLHDHPSLLQSQVQSIGQKIRRIDFVGSTLLLGACVLLIAGLEEGGIRYSWTSALPLTTVIVSVALWISLVMWSRALYRRQTKVESVFPWELLRNRFAMGALASAFFSGAVFLALAISLPQRFQIVHGSSPFLSAVYVLPLTISGPLGGVSTGLLLTKLQIPPLFVLIGSAILQLIGLALLGSQSIIDGIPAAVYGLQVLFGIGQGINFTTSILLIPMSVGRDLSAVGLGSIGQVRNLGGSVAVAILTNVLNSSVKDVLLGVLSPDQLNSYLQSASSISTLPAQVQNQAKQAFEDGYQLQLRVLLAFTCGAILSAFLIFERHPRHQNKKGELVRN